MLNTRPGYNVFLKLRHLGTQDPLPALHCGLNGTIEWLTETAALSLQVNEGNGLGHKSPKKECKF